MASLRKSTQLFFNPSGPERKKRKLCRECYRILRVIQHGNDYANRNVSIVIIYTVTTALKKHVFVDHVLTIHINHSFFINLYTCTFGPYTNKALITIVCFIIILSMLVRYLIVSLSVNV